MSNRLAGQTSPYLRQHSDNPVDWHPWGAEAFAEATKRDVPILLSVGYSACHWCHVMAHESFENPDVAALMNQWFVPVKVDREERPDVDSIYMEATQAMTGRGGWPMTVFMDDQGRPFFAGTYFPPTARGGMPGFSDLMEAVHEAWTNRRGELLEQADQLTEAISAALPTGSGDGSPNPDIPEAYLAAATQTLLEQHDPQWGGFGAAPKFPQTHSLGLLMRQYQLDGDSESLKAVTTTLDAMAAGGMMDHIGGGFSRYSVDRQWLVPHFEKMLYDNALLTRVYLDAHLLTGEPGYADVTTRTIEYVLRDLSHPDGGRYSAEDADSLADISSDHAEEGLFYTFTPAEIEVALGDAGIAEQIDEVLQHWGVVGEPNFEGRWILNRARHRSEYTCPQHLEPARAALGDYRNRRPRPGLDDKVLTEWNALWISATAAAGAALDRADWIAESERTADFLLANLRTGDGRWLRSWQDRNPDPHTTDGRAQHLAYSADYASLVEAFTELYFATGKQHWLSEALRTARDIIDLFWDPEGGMFTTGSDAEELLVRPREFTDNATAAATSTAALSFLQLEALTADSTLGDPARSIIARLGHLAAKAPLGFGRLLAAMHLSAVGATEVVTTGGQPMAAVIQQRFTPSTVLAWNERGTGSLWQGRDAPGLAWVCRNLTCEAPVGDPASLAAAMDRV